MLPFVGDGNILLALQLAASDSQHRLLGDQFGPFLIFLYLSGFAFLCAFASRWTPRKRGQLTDLLLLLEAGGARGIGAGIVRRFVEEGARVVFSDLLREEGAALEKNSVKTRRFFKATQRGPSDMQSRKDARIWPEVSRGQKAISW
jgi:hypothetical protein